MPLAFAFKNAQRAAQLESAMGSALDLEIARFTEGRFCHVEAWIRGPITAAVCFSSRQPHGTYFETIDLSDTSLWEIVTVSTTDMEDAEVMGFCIGCSGRKYDTYGILGIGLVSTLHDPFDRICSEVCYQIPSDVLHRPFPPGIERWQVAPSGITVPGKRYGFYELLKGVSA